MRDQEISTHLTEDMDDVTTVASVNDATLVSRGRIEIDNELIWVDRPDRDNNTAIILPTGGGWMGRMLSRTPLAPG